MRAAIPDDPEVAPDAEEIRTVSRTVYVSRIWYVPALALSLGIFIMIWLGLDSIEVPVGQFLYDLAICSTVWSHGQCVWL
jgi:hypothetical protein